jgi:acyl-coenzyme A thioesterase 13
MATPASDAAARFLRDAASAGTYDAAPLRRCSNAASATRGRFACDLTVTRELTNRFGTLHGGAIATIVDVLTTAALLTMTTRGGVSVELSCAYCAPATLEETVRVECEVVKMGKTLAWMECRMTRASDGEVVATGKHTKFLPVGTTSKL